MKLSTRKSGGADGPAPDVGADVPKADGGVPAGGRARRRRHRGPIAARLDQFAFLAAKAVAFGLVAGLVGVAAAALFRQSADDPAAADLAAEVAALTSEVAALGERVSALEGDSSEASLGASGIAALRSEIADAAARANELSTRTANLEHGQLTVRRRVDALDGESRPASGDGTASSGAVPVHFENLERRVGSLERNEADAFDPSELEARIAENERRIAALDRAEWEASSSRAALIGALAAARIGAPYLGLLEESGRDPAEIPEVVLMHAEPGVASLDELGAEFPEYAREVLRRGGAHADSDGAVSRAVGSLFQVRPLSPQDGDGPAAILSRAEDRLRNGDLRGAVSQLAALSAEGQEIMADWVDAAESRLAVLAGFDSMLMAPGGN